MNEPALNGLGCSVSQPCKRILYGSLSDPWPPLLSLPTLPRWTLSVNGILSLSRSKPGHHFSFLPPSSTHIQPAATAVSCINSFSSSFLQPLPVPPTPHRPPYPSSGHPIVSYLAPCQQVFSLQSVLHWGVRVGFLMARSDHVSPTLKN